MPAYSITPDGRKEVTWYHKGSYNASTGVFTKGSGSHFRVLTLNGFENNVSGSSLKTAWDSTTIPAIYMHPSKSTIEETIRDARGFTVQTATYLYENGKGATIDRSKMEYDGAGNLTKRTTLSGLEYTATYKGGRKTSETSEAGVTMDYEYDAFGRVHKEIEDFAPYKDAEDNTMVFPTTRVFEYDAENRVTEVKTIKDGDPASAGGITLSQAYDEASRRTSYTDAYGRTITTTYEDGGDKVTTTFPDGTTLIEESYMDGRPKVTRGTATTGKYHKYRYKERDGSTDDYVLRESVYPHVTTDSAATSAVWWSVTDHDFMGRPFFGAGTFSGTGEAHWWKTYDTQGRVIIEEREGQPDTLYSYNQYAELLKITRDVDGDGASKTDSMDEVSYQATNYKKIGNDWYIESKKGIYPKDNNSTLLIYSTTREQLTGLSTSRAAYTETEDVNGNKQTVKVSIDRANGLVTEEYTNDLQTQKAYSYSQYGRPIESTSFSGVQVLKYYDNLGRLKKSSDRTGDTTLRYASNSLKLEETRFPHHPDARETYTYDENMRITKRFTYTTASNWVASRYAYNNRGQLTKVWGHVPYPVYREYDSRGLLSTQTTYRDTSTNFTHYNWPSEIDASAGDTTTFYYHPEDGTLEKVKDAAGKERKYEYNKSGQLTKRTFPQSNRETTYEYFDSGSDRSARLKKVDYADGSMTDLEYTYHRFGGIKTVKDASGTSTHTYRTGSDYQPDYVTFPNSLYGANHNRLDFTYYGDGRLSGIRVGNGSTWKHSNDYGYDSVTGRLDTLTSPNGNYTFGYLSNSDLINVVDRASANGLHYYKDVDYYSNRNIPERVETTLVRGQVPLALVEGYTYEHDIRNRRTAETRDGFASWYAYDGPVKVSYGYNNRNELTWAQGNWEPEGANTKLPDHTFGYQYDAVGSRISTSKGNTSGDDQTYDSNELNQYTSRANSTEHWFAGTAKGGTVKINNQNPDVTAGSYFAWDYTSNASSAKRLTANMTLTGGGNSVSVSQSREVPATNEIFSHDQNGNLTGDSMWTYAYDGENRIKQMTHTSGMTYPHKRLSFKYDYMGRRFEKKVETKANSGAGWVTQETRRHLFSGSLILAETVNGSLKKAMTWGPDLSGSIGVAGGISGLYEIEDFTAQHSGNYIVTSDASGNVTSLINAETNEPAAMYAYGPFGERVRAIGPYAQANTFRFASKPFDPETGLSNFGFRHYHADIGRWTAQDPLYEQGRIAMLSKLASASQSAIRWTSMAHPGMGGLKAASEAQDAMLSNTSLSHKGEQVSFGEFKNTTLVQTFRGAGKGYSATSASWGTSSVKMGNAPTSSPIATSGGHIGWREANLYGYVVNNPFGGYDAHGLETDEKEKPKTERNYKHDGLTTVYKLDGTTFASSPSRGSGSRNSPSATSPSAENSSQISESASPGNPSTQKKEDMNVYAFYDPEGYPGYGHVGLGVDLEDGRMLRVDYAQDIRGPDKYFDNIEDASQGHVVIKLQNHKLDDGWATDKVLEFFNSPTKEQIGGFGRVNLSGIGMGNHSLAYCSTIAARCLDRAGYQTGFDFGIRGGTVRGLLSPYMGITHGGGTKYWPRNGAEIIVPETK
ncbi:MAG: hypothetical protein MK130_07315 [Puniceicoccaceae bacterium]|nr:hypothetical protein [Puniceicoccaceae bacterium]NRA27003.1 hypothetical protein [Opitutales bacterium]